MGDGKDGKRALIIGGSMAGLLSALLLRRVGWRVDVFERSTDDLASRGAGIATHPELQEILAAAGADAGDALGVKISGRATFRRDGSVVGTHALPQVMTSWDLLYKLLLAPLPDELYHVGVPLERVERDADGVTAHFADGRTERGDILVAADGVRSTVRGQMLPELRPTYAGYVAWRGMAPEAALSEATRDALGDRLCFALPPNEQFLTYPIAGENETLEPGRRRRNWVWYRAARSDSEQAALMTGTDGRRHEVSVSPDRMNPEAIAAMRRDASDALPPQLIDLIDGTERPFLQAIFDLESPEVVFGRVAVIGDAAFVARPHTGMGVTKAAVDAMALAKGLEAAGGDIDAGLAAFRETCMRYGKAAVERGRTLGRILIADRDRADSDAFGLERGVPKAVMVETAVPGDLRA